MSQRIRENILAGMAGLGAVFLLLLIILAIVHHSEDDKQDAKCKLYMTPDDCVKDCACNWCIIGTNSSGSCGLLSNSPCPPIAAGTWNCTANMLVITMIVITVFIALLYVIMTIIFCISRQEKHEKYHLLRNIGPSHYVTETH